MIEIKTHDRRIHVRRAEIEITQKAVPSAVFGRSGLAADGSVAEEGALSRLKRAKRS